MSEPWSTEYAVHDLKRRLENLEAEVKALRNAVAPQHFTGQYSVHHREMRPTGKLGGLSWRQAFEEVGITPCDKNLRPPEEDDGA